MYAFFSYAKLRIVPSALFAFHVEYSFGAEFDFNLSLVKELAIETFLSPSSTSHVVAVELDPNSTLVACLLNKNQNYPTEIGAARFHLVFNVDVEVGVLLKVHFLPIEHV